MENKLDITMGISHIASKGKSCPAPLLAENTKKIEDISNCFFPLKRIQTTASMCVLLSAKPTFLLVCSSHCCSSRQTKL